MVETVTTDDERVLKEGCWLNGDQVVKISRLSACSRQLVKKRSQVK